MRDRADIAAAIAAFSDSVMRLCALYLHERADREDIMQETFLRYAQHDAPFAGEEHKRAWLLRVATNLCKDLLKSAASRNESLDSLREDTQYDVEDESADDGSAALERSELMAALRSLDDKYRLVLYLTYYEGYTAAQVSKVLGMPENTVYTNLSRGKKMLRGVLEHGKRVG